ncbi:DUF2325 domain-containing protein [Paenibacillus sp. 1001270B_150601_E10]|uniref:DUF2325 domain-containing protein n=1 Tax=Paenibacillus sp. 1001270B_150601_E10 TaxID=2787079 RepID=UPI00189EB524|nr:DUF2325 domain-containing protein [Paenibacillus sp. 1001270B_150601_E10]
MSKDMPVLDDELMPYLHRIQEDCAASFPIEPVRYFLQELSDKKKRTLIHQLKLPIRIYSKKPFPQAVLHKHILSMYNHKEGRPKLLAGILYAIADMYELEEANNAASLLEQQEAMINRYGIWHYYWALRLLPERDEELDTRMEVVYRKALEHDAVPQDESQEADSPKIDSSDEDESKEPAHLSKATALLKRKLEREMVQRQKFEQEIAQLHKQLRHQDKVNEQLHSIKGKMERDLQEALERESTLREELHHQRLRAGEVESENKRLRHQKRMIEGEYKALQSTISQMEQEMSEHKGLIASLEHEHRRLKQLQAEERSKLEQPINLAHLLLNGLLEESEKLCSKFSKDHDHRAELRHSIRTRFDLIDQLERYQELAHDPLEQMQDATEHEFFPTIPLEAPSEQAQPIQSEEELEEHTVSIDLKAEQQALNGTFYRRDHGGFIELEDGKVFNITESMVYQHQLQHEAEVLCTPYKKSGGSLLYEIELLLQGDDDHSPITQFDGYIQAGEHQTWYCVNLNDPSIRYPLHYKDVQIQRPQDGDACLFNVADGKHIARISRIYREMLPDPLTKNKLPAAKSSTTALPRSKPQSDPFLEGCRIVIIGGQQKWFEPVVKDTGAELIHENGENPGRILSTLRRSNALFMLLTATSHRATWSCVEIAKQHHIPHFVIQGSKSNLRALLWENRHLIQGCHEEDRRAIEA